MAEELETESVTIDELFEPDNQQFERLSSLAQRKHTFGDQFNYQEVRQKLEHNTPVRIGTKGIRGQPREVQWRSSKYFGAKQWDWRAVDEQVIEVIVVWHVAPVEPVEVTFSVFGA